MRYYWGIKECGQIPIQEQVEIERRHNAKLIAEEARKRADAMLKERNKENRDDGTADSA